MGRAGFEPAAWWLKATCTAFVLTAQHGAHFIYYAPKYCSKTQKRPQNEVPKTSGNKCKHRSEIHRHIWNSLTDLLI